MVVASTVQASAGMGQGLISAPLLRLLEPDLLPVPIVIAGLLTTAVVAKRNSQLADLHQVKPAIVGRIIGNVMAVGLLFALSDRGLTIGIGLIVLFYVGLRLAGLHVPMSTGSLTAAGVASGIGGTIAALGGAPMGLLYEQHAQARNFRGPLGAFGMVGVSLSIVILAIAGEFDTRALGLSLALIPPLLFGWLLAKWVTPIIDRGFLSPLVLGISSASAVVLLASELL